MKSRTKTQLLMELKKKATKNRIEEIKNMLEIQGEEEEDLSGLNVKIKMDDYVFRAQKGELSENFISWLSENGDKTYKATKAIDLEDMKNFYSLDGVDTWIFNKLDLEVVE